MITLEKTLLSLVWEDSKQEVAKISLLNRDWFEDKNLFDRVKAFRDAGHPADIILSGEIMGIDETKEIVAAYGACGGIDLWDNYLNQFKALQAQRNILQKADSLTLTADDCRAAIPLLEKQEEDERDYDLKQDALDYFERLERRKVGDVEWYNLGLPALDKCIGHIRPCDMIVISGKGGLGKSTFGLKVFDFLNKQNVPGILFSSEMDYDSNMDKIIALNTGLNSNAIRNGNVSTEDMKLINERVSTNIYGKPGRIIESALHSTETLKKKILQHNAKYIIVDNIQRFSIGDLRGINKADYLEEIAKSLKDIAIELKIFVIILSQVNDANELRGSRGIYNNTDYEINLELKEETPVVKRIKVYIAKGRFCAQPNFMFIMDRTTGDFTEEVIDNTPSIWEKS